MFAIEPRALARIVSRAILFGLAEYKRAIIDQRFQSRCAGKMSHLKNGGRLVGTDVQVPEADRRISHMLQCSQFH